MINIVLLSKKLLDFHISESKEQLILHTIKQNIDTVSNMSLARQSLFLNTMILAIIKLPYTHAVSAIDIIWLLQRQSHNFEYLELARKHLLVSKGDCEKVAVIKAILFVQDVNHISPLLNELPVIDDIRQKENSVRKIALFLKNTSARTLQSDTLSWQTTITAFRKTLTCSKRTKQYLDEILETIA